MLIPRKEEPCIHSGKKTVEMLDILEIVNLEGIILESDNFGTKTILEVKHFEFGEKNRA